MTDTPANEVNTSTAPSLLDKSEEDLYGMAMIEMKSESRREGLWARVLSDAMGDKPKAEALYIRYRTKQLVTDQHVEMQDAKRRDKIEAERATPVFFNCPECGKKLKLTKGTLSDIEASANQSWIRRCPGCTKTFDCRNVIPKSNYQLSPPPPSAVNNSQSHAPSVRSGSSLTQSNSGNKILAVVVFLILMFIGTAFATSSVGGSFNRLIGYIFGGMAFTFAAMLWNKK